MFGPVVWLVLSSFKSSAEVVKFPPRLLPYRQETVEIEGYDEPLPLYRSHLKMVLQLPGADSPGWYGSAND